MLKSNNRLLAGVDAAPSAPTRGRRPKHGAGGRAAPGGAVPAGRRRRVARALRRAGGGRAGRRSTAATAPSTGCRPASSPT
ncbi:MAG: hypothetical protein MZV63_27060 [Marinilabiliales bacterium]|nr:hypothetical protein [Marinilabiliales bacterium]